MRQGLAVTELPEGKRERLRQFFPAFYGINNPLDLTAQVKDEDYRAALSELKEEYDGFLVIALPNVFGITEGLAEVMRESKGIVGKPIVSHIPPGGIAARLTSLLEKAGIPVYSSPEAAIRGLKALLR